MASMNLDPSSALAEKYKGNRQILEAAVLGRGADANIDPYSALRALQKLNVADKYEQMQKAMAGQPNQPSVAQQTLAQAAQGQQPAPAPQAPAPQAPQGLGAMPVPEDTFNMAGGGIVAFAAGDEVPTTTTTGTRATSATYNLSTELDPAKMDEYMAEYNKRAKPEEYYAQYRKKLEDMSGYREGELEQSKGLAALQAAAALSQGSDLVRGIGAAGAAFGESYGKAVDAANKEKRALDKMQLAMEDAQRQEALGNWKEARAAASEYRAQKNQAEQFNEQKRQFEVNAGLKREEIDAAKQAAAAKGKDPSDHMQFYAINLQNILSRKLAEKPEAGETPEQFRGRATLEAREEALNRTADQFRDLGTQEIAKARLTEFEKAVANIKKDAAVRAKSDPKGLEKDMQDLYLRFPEYDPAVSGGPKLPTGFTLD